MNRHVLLATSLLLATASASAQDASAPQPWTWDDLVRRVELRPYVCQLTTTCRWSGKEVSKGTEVTVVDISADAVRLCLDGGALVACDPGDTDFLARANAAYASWSDEQRAIDAAFLEQCADLWPATVRARVEIRYPDAVLDAGDELTALRVQGGNVVVRSPKFENPVLVPAYATDFCQRVREALADPERVRQHWILAELADKLVRLPTGRSKRVEKVKVDARKPCDYTLVYFSAGWCGHCHEFNPELLAFHQRHKRLIGKRLEVLWVSRDKSEAEMLEYARSAGFPWPTVPWSKLGEVPRTLGLQGGGTPHLTLLDERGAVVAMTYVGAYDHPRKLLAEIEKRLAK